MNCWMKCILPDYLNEEGIVNEDSTFETYYKDGVVCVNLLDEEGKRIDTPDLGGVCRARTFADDFEEDEWCECSENCPVHSGQMHDTEIMNEYLLGMLNAICVTLQKLDSIREKAKMSKFEGGYANE